MSTLQGHFFRQLEKNVLLGETASLPFLPPQKTAIRKDSGFLGMTEMNAEGF